MKKINFLHLAIIIFLIQTTVPLLEIQILESDLFGLELKAVIVYCSAWLAALCVITHYKLHLSKKTKLIDKKVLR